MRRLLWLCTLFLLVSAVGTNWANLPLGSSELAAASGTCPGICYEWGSCSTVLEGDGVQTYCTGSGSPVYWCVDHDPGFTTCGTCQDLISGGCGKIVYYYTNTGETWESNIDCDKCNEPDSSYECPSS